MRGMTRALNKRATEEQMRDFQTRCRQASLKVTPQRMAVYRALVETTEHPSAEVIFRKVRRKFPSISLDTVNRTLLTLSDMGVAFVVEGSGDAKRFDANLCAHQHFKCLKCRRIIDFHYEPFDEICVPENLADHFTVLRKTVYLEGLCDRCNDGS